MKKYEHYKNSGVEWLGDIPEHWEVKKLKHLGNIFPGLNGKKGDDFSKEFTEGIKSFIPFTNICNNHIISDEQFQYVKVKKNEIQNRVKKNDILFLMSSETLEDIAKNSIYLGDEEELYLNSFCKGFRINNSTINAEFINYLVSCKSYRQYFSLVGRGFTRINIKQEFINDVTVIFPPLQEQIAIAEFLDDKTAKIDQAIGIKQQQINLLKERRQILIHKAVTQGINPDVKLKDSGVEWIGEIPEGWEVKRLKFNLTKSFSGGTPSTDKLLYWDGGIPWVSSVDVKVDNLDKTLREISLLGLRNSSANIAPKGALIFVTRSGILQHTFAISILNKEMAINQDIKCIIFNDKIQSEYFLNLIKGNNSEILVEVRQQAATVESINMSSFYNLLIPNPPIEEQKAISAYIEIATDKIVTAISLKELEIEKLKEYKSSLIDGVVTGKVKIN